MTPSDIALPEQLMHFLAQLEDVPQLTDDDLERALAASTLPARPVLHRPAFLRIPCPAEADLDQVEIETRALLDERYGTASTTNPHWLVGPAELRLRARADGFTVMFGARNAVARMRLAAESWLAGDEVRPWLVENGFATEEVLADDAPVKLPRGVDIGEEQARIHLDLNTTDRAPGDTSRKDDDRFDAILDHLTEALGYSEITGWWYRGSRSFGIRRMRSYSRSVEFHEARPGFVRHQASTWELPSTPDPDPHEAVALIMALRDQLGDSWDHAVSRLMAAGHLSFTPPEREKDAVIVQDAQGRPVKLTVTEDMVTAGIIDIAASTTSPETIDAALQEHLGPWDERAHDRTLWRKDGVEIAAWHSSKFSLNRLERRPARAMLTDPA